MWRHRTPWATVRAGQGAGHESCRLWVSGSTGCRPQGQGLDMSHCCCLQCARCRDWLAGGCLTRMLVYMEARNASATCTGGASTMENEMGEPVRQSQMTVPETPSPDILATAKPDARVRRRDFGASTPQPSSPLRSEPDRPHTLNGVFTALNASWAVARHDRSHPTNEREVVSVMWWCSRSGPHLSRTGEARTTCIARHVVLCMTWSQKAASTASPWTRCLLEPQSG